MDVKIFVDGGIKIDPQTSIEKQFLEFLYQVLYRENGSVRATKPNGEAQEFIVKGSKQILETKTLRIHEEKPQ
jgi:hypothetical protein